MIFKIEFKNESEKEQIINANKDKYLVEVEYLLKGNFLTFSDTPTIENLIQEQADKISILEAENDSLRKGLQAVLNGDMQSLAYILYPEDFTDVNKSNTTLEL